MKYTWYDNGDDYYSNVGKEHIIMQFGRTQSFLYRILCQNYDILTILGQGS